MKEECVKIDLSVVVPVYNVEDYVMVCVDSLLRIESLSMEIVLVDDGSTDLSGAIIDQYAKHDERIRVIHQANGGASVARNAGLDLVRGEYILFVDSDDWVQGDALVTLFRMGVESKADVVMGEIRFCDQEGNLGELFNPVKGIQSTVLKGGGGFAELMMDGSYLPTPARFVYRRDFLREIGARFEEGIIHEDELWTPVVLCQADKLVITRTEFYIYRQNQASVMHTTKRSRRLCSLFRVVDRLARFAERWSFDGEERIVKSWWYVNLFRLYNWAFLYLIETHDSTIEVSTCHLDRFWRDCGRMVPESVIKCRPHFLSARENLSKYMDWRILLESSVEYWIETGKKFFLFLTGYMRKCQLFHKNACLKDGWSLLTEATLTGLIGECSICPPYFPKWNMTWRNVLGRFGSTCIGRTNEKIHYSWIPK